MSRDTERYIYGIVGNSGSGKTFLAEQCLAAYLRPVFVVDTMNEWAEYGSTFHEPEPMLRHAGQALAGEEEMPPGGIYRLKADATWKAEEAFLYADAWGVPGTYITDELHRVAPSGQSTDFLEMVRTGRHASQSIVGITQRPQGVHNHFMEESALAVFRLKRRGANSAASYLPPTLDPEALQRLEPQEYVLGGPSEHKRLPLDLGDCDGSVWTYNAETHEVERVRDSP